MRLTFSKYWNFRISFIKEKICPISFNFLPHLRGSAKTANRPPPKKKRERENKMSIIEKVGS